MKLADTTQGIPWMVELRNQSITLLARRRLSLSHPKRSVIFPVCCSYRGRTIAAPPRTASTRTAASTSWRCRGARSTRRRRSRGACGRRAGTWCTTNTSPSGSGERGGAGGVQAGGVREWKGNKGEGEEGLKGGGEIGVLARQKLTEQHGNGRVHPRKGRN